MTEHASLRTKEQKHAEAFVRRCGYQRGGAVSDAREDKREDERQVARGVHKHETHMHKGEPLTKLKRGGAVDGEKPRGRLDKPGRGGRGKVNITIVSGGNNGEAEKQQAAQQGVRAGMQLGAHAAMQHVAGGPGGPPPPGVAGPPGAGAAAGPPMMPPRPMPPGMAPGMPPPGLPQRPPGMKRGGAVKLTAGAGSGLGRLEKEGLEGKIRVKSHYRRRGGAV